MRGLCCSDRGVFKPGERETGRRLADRCGTVNAETAGGGEANLKQVCIVYVSNNIVAPAHSHAVEPCNGDRRHQVTLRPSLRCATRQWSATQAVMDRADRIKSGGADSHFRSFASD